MQRGSATKQEDTPRLIHVEKSQKVEASLVEIDGRQTVILTSLPSPRKKVKAAIGSGLVVVAGFMGFTKYDAVPPGLRHPVENAIQVATASHKSSSKLVILPPELGGGLALVPPGWLTDSEDMDALFSLLYALSDRLTQATGTSLESLSQSDRQRLSERILFSLTRLQAETILGGQLTEPSHTLMGLLEYAASLEPAGDAEAAVEWLLSAPPTNTDEVVLPSGTTAPHEASHEGVEAVVDLATIWNQLHGRSQGGIRARGHR